ncbi:transposase, partial [Candidatus Bipolaricaulota bacterium]|nr:transposase [Candidatus Bipolaricaulota bacterium]
MLGTASTPGGVVSIQTFGSLMLWNPHIHAVVTDGAFESKDTFRPLGEVPAEP